MENIMFFENDKFGKITMIVKDNKEYFAATQVAKILGYTNPRKAVLDHCFIDGVTYCYVIDNMGRKQNIKFIDEGNLYALIMKSRLDSAKDFRAWICNIVIPSIRKHGAYMSDEALDKALKNPNFLDKLIHSLKDEQKQRIKAQNKANHLKAVIKENSKYTELGRGIYQAGGAITVSQFAKLLNNNGIRIGRNRLYEWLRENNYLIKSGQEKNKAKQVYIEQGLFQVEEFVVNTDEGEKLSIKTLITGKGQIYLFEKLQSRPLKMSM